MRRTFSQWEVVVAQALIGVGVTFLAFFAPSVPFALALVPLVAGVLMGTRRARAAAMACFMLWPVMISAIGLIGTELDAVMVWGGAVAGLTALAGLAAFAGVTGTTLMLLAVPVFPASPLLPLASLSGGSLLWIVVSLTIASCVEYAGPRSLYLRAGLLAIPVTALIGVHVAPLMRAEGAEHAAQARPVWQELRVPPALTERGQWLVLRDSLPTGATVVLGENMFRAEDAEPLSFWCRAARARDLTVFIGVSEPYGGTRRGAVWRLDSDRCRPRPISAQYRARLGIPGLTGTWGRMERAADEATVSAVAHRDPEADWLICFEAFLPWAWAGLLQDGATAAPVVILSNDSAFGAQAGAMSTLRRKAAAALGRLTGRPVHHAEAGRTYLIAGGPTL